MNKQWSILTRNHPSLASERRKFYFLERFKAVGFASILSDSGPFCLDIF